MNYFKCSTYQREDVSVLQAYMQNTIAYLRRLHPEVSTDKIRDFVNAQIQTSLTRPTLKMINYPSYGNAQIEDRDLLEYTDVIRQNIITPSATLYVKPSVKESFLKRKLLDNMAVRKIHKKRMLKAAVDGDLGLEQRENYLQSSVKIETNAIPGAFNSPHNPLYDKPGYNATTSISRHSIMCGYAHTEKMVAGNFYFPTVDSCINYCIQMVRLCPSDTMEVTTEFGLTVPSVQNVFDHFYQSLKLYQHVTPIIKTTLINFFTSLTPGERTFVFYAYCLKNLIMCNDHVFRPFLKDFFRTDLDADPNVPLTDIFKLNGDMMAFISGLNSEAIQHKSVSEAVIENNPGIRHLIAIGHHMQSKLDGISRIISTFLRVDCDTPDAMSHPNMIRKTVIISDTDSVIFSTQHWVEWYLGKVTFIPDAYAINGFVVMMLTLTLEQVFARLSTNFGADTGDIYRISMKNEFLYPLMLRTPLPKQYAGRVLIQEGFVLPKPKEDIKGLSFRDSSMCKETVRAGKDFVNWIFDTVIDKGGLTVEECLGKVLDHETRVIKSLEAGERTFLSTTPIRNASDYVDAASSNHYYWKLWDAVFRPKFGELVIPNKGYEIPLMGDGKVLKDPRYLARLKEYDSSLYERLLVFMDQNKRKITRLILPMTLKQIPDIIRPIIDIRGIVYDNSTPFIVTMRSLGIVWTNPRDQTLLSDIYKKDEFGCALLDSNDISSAA